MQSNAINCGPINIAVTVRNARYRTKLTQEKFCAFLRSAEPTSIQVTRRDLSKYETGKNVPPADKFLKIIRVSECIAQ
jgi:transcriptional regulator with XRE-family HTH domain